MLLVKNMSTFSEWQCLPALTGVLECKDIRQFAIKASFLANIIVIQKSSVTVVNFVHLQEQIKIAT